MGKEAKMDLGTRIKEYEKESETIIKLKDNICIRLDGHKFSRFTKNMNKPFDEIFVEVMKKTAKDLLLEFNAVTSYVQSDEITIILPSLSEVSKKGWVHQSGGRTQKLASLTAGYATLRFNKHLRDSVQNISDEAYFLKMKDKLDVGYFDARVFGVPTASEVFNTILFRVRDAEKNSRSMFSSTYCSHKELMHKNSLEQVQYCLDKTGNDWDLITDHLKFGTFFKKEQYNKSKDVIRSRVVEYSEKLQYSDSKVQELIRKYK